MGGGDNLRNLREVKTVGELLGGGDNLRNLREVKTDGSMLAGKCKNIHILGVGGGGI